MDIIVHTSLSPRIIEVLSPTTDVTVQEVVNTVRDWEDDNLSFEALISAAGKEALGGGVTVGITATLQNARLMFEGRTVVLEVTGRVLQTIQLGRFSLRWGDSLLPTEFILGVRFSTIPQVGWRVCQR